LTETDPEETEALATTDEFETGRGGREIKVVFMSSAAFAAFSFSDVIKNITQLRDRIYFGSGEYLPIIGTLKISYARLIQLLLKKRVKRVYLMADGQVAIVEVPFETHASDYKGVVKYDKNDLSIVYVDQKPEWKMEKMRYYCELPGDIWEDGTFLKLMKRNQYHRTKNNRMKYEWMLKEHQVTAELVVMDPNEAYVFLNDFMGQFIPIVSLFALRAIVWLGDKFAEKYGKKKKDPMAELAEQYTRPRAIEFNVGEGEERNDTGVRFEDVAGIDRVKSNVIEVLKIMRGDERYKRIGAKAPKGIVLEGPPGTGKTYLAKAMAGEGGMPFYSCNGAEFVEMFSGIAAARIQNLFKMAREKAPSIIFIDEIDAIGKRRGEGGDSGSAEREAGLMQLLVEMDGSYGEDDVLVIGATNRIGLLDPALMRPGRFDQVIYMGLPSESNRLKILEVHARGKPVGENPADAARILAETAKVTLGYSGADLANLLNEAAILSVRAANLEDAEAVSDSASIQMFHIREAIGKAKLGLPQEGLPDSKAKKFLVTVQAGRAVALAITPGIPQIDAVTTKPQGGILGRIYFQNREYGARGDKWHQLVYPGYEVNSVKLNRHPSMFEAISALLVPLFSARATEEILFGTTSVTLSSSEDIAVAGDLAYFLVAKSNLHPAFRHIPVKMTGIMGGMDDPTLKHTSHWFERYTSHLQEVAYQKTRRIIEQYRPVIEKVADLIYRDEQEMIFGSELVEIINSTPLAPTNIPEPTFSFDDVAKSFNGVPEIEDPAEYKGYVGTCSFFEATGEATFERPIYVSDKRFEISEATARQAAEVIIGNADVFSLLTPDIAKSKLKQVREALRKRSSRVRLEAIRRYSLGEDLKMPPSPVLDTDKPKPKVFYDSLRQGASDPVEMVEDFNFWRNRSGATRE